MEPIAIATPVPIGVTAVQPENDKEVSPWLPCCNIIWILFAICNLPYSKSIASVMLFDCVFAFAFWIKKMFEPNKNHLYLEMTRLTWDLACVVLGLYLLRNYSGKICEMVFLVEIIINSISFAFAFDIYIAIVIKMVKQN
jgi:hypothetical protein